MFWSFLIDLFDVLMDPFLVFVPNELMNYARKRLSQLSLCHVCRIGGVEESRNHRKSDRTMTGIHHRFQSWFPVTLRPQTCKIMWKAPASRSNCFELVISNKLLVSRDITDVPTFGPQAVTSFVRGRLRTASSWFSPGRLAQCEDRANSVMFSRGQSRHHPL